MIHIRKYITALLLCCLAIYQPVSGQNIWPGDVNNNGIVNGVDLLYWGVAFGTSGPARAEVNTDWQGIPLVSTWPQSFVDGVNYVYADCDGSGLVDEDDYDDAIEDNFGLTHGTPSPDGFANGVAGSAPRLRLQPDSDVVGFGATVNIGLSFEAGDLPMTDFYGLALKLSYTTGVLAGDDGPDFDFTENSWIEADNSYVQELFVDNGGGGRADLAVSRTNQQTVLVAPGQIGRFSIVIEDIIVGKSVDTFDLRIDSVLLIGSDLEVTPVVPDTARIIITNDTTLTRIDDRRQLQKIKVYPNPVRNECYLEISTPVSAPMLTDQLGRTIPVELHTLGRGLYLLRPPSLPPGMYWFSARTPEGRIGEKIIFLNN